MNFKDGAGMDQQTMTTLAALLSQNSTQFQGAGIFSLMALIQQIMGGGGLGMGGGGGNTSRPRISGLSTYKTDGKATTDITISGSGFDPSAVIVNQTGKNGTLKAQTTTLKDVGASKLTWPMGAGQAADNYYITVQNGPDGTPSNPATVQYGAGSSSGQQEPPKCDPGFEWNGTACVKQEDEVPNPLVCPDGYHDEEGVCVSNNPGRANLGGGQGLEDMDLPGILLRRAA